MSKPQSHTFFGALVFSVLFGAMLCPVSGRSAMPSDTVKIYFLRGYRYFYPSYLDNGVRMNRFLDSVRSADSAHIVDRVEIRTYASPDGSSAANRLLTVNRCREIAGHIVSRTGISPDLIDSRPEGIAWDQLYNTVRETPSVPYREEVLDVLAQTPVQTLDRDNRLSGSRKKALMDLRGGVPYRWLYDNVFPKLRNAIAVSLYTVEEPAQAKPIAETIETNTDTIIPAPDYTEEFVEPAQEKREPIHAFALKTNLVYDALLCPNLSFEWRINERWSVLAEANVAWWKRESHHRFYQLMYLGAEGRYWFKTRGPWHGFYAGVMGGGGKYDLSGGHTGYKGEAGLGGVTCGFMFPVSKNISFDAEIGLGYLYTKYEEYIPHDGHYLYQRTSRTGYFGPVKAQFSLVWRFGDSAGIMKGGRK